MFRALLSIALTLVLTMPSEAAITGSFRKVGGINVGDLIFPGEDGWVFEVQSQDLHFDTYNLTFTSPDGNFIRFHGTNSGELSRPVAAQAVIFGIEAADTFFVIPNGAMLPTPSPIDSATTLSGASSCKAPPCHHQARQLRKS